MPSLTGKIVFFFGCSRNVEWGLNAVKDSRNGIHSVSAIPYAEGVVFQSPGSAPPRKRQSATLGDCRAERLTPKALYRTFDGRFILVERLQRTCFRRLFTQGARPTTATPRHPRPWALEYNRFAVKTQTVDALDEESLTALGGRGRGWTERSEGSPRASFA